MRPRSLDSIPLRTAKWLGSAAGVIGALIIAMNLGLVVHGFVLFLVSSILWSTVSWVQREASLLVLQATFTVIRADSD
jgi:hypothetical protein